MVLIGFLALGLFVWLVGRALTKKRGAQRFVALGNIVGRPIGDIIAKVGQPSSISSTATGSLYQWIKASAFGGYHYAISVDSEKRAIGYTHQFSR